MNLKGFYGCLSGVSFLLLFTHLVLLLPGVLTVVSAEPTTSFVVRIESSQIHKVATRYRQQGYLIQEQNTKYGFLVVSDQASVSATAAGPLDNSTCLVPGWLRHYRQNATNEAAWYIDRGTGGLHAGATSGTAATTAAGIQLQRQLPSYGQSAYTPTAATASSATSTARAAAVKQQLLSASGVRSVERNVVATLLDRSLSQQIRKLQQQMASVASAAEPTAGASNSSQPTCSEKISYNPDIQVGRAVEGSPYGISLVEADTDTMVQISKEHNNKIIWCVIDTGLDRANPEFDPSFTSGCTPGAVRTDGSAHACKHNWYDEIDGHGTHTSGSIGARRNGEGIVGVAAEGARIYHYNIFGPRDAAGNMSFTLTDAITAWDDCIAELDAQKAATATPDMKMVISMSFGGESGVSVLGYALATIAQERSDVLFVAAAGNTGANDIMYPAAYPEVVSVGAVAWDSVIADFSTYNTDVEWTAPGYGVLSTIPVWAAANSSYNDIARLTITGYQPDDPNAFLFPPLLLMGGSARGSVTAELFDCGSGNEPCTGASGKVCLVQRNTGSACSKVLNCLAGGGIAAIMYNSETVSECSMLSASLTCSASLQPPANGWPIALTAARAQGQVLKQALGVNPALTVTIDTGSGKVALEMLSGTSMACPIAAGVAGLVWSAHTNCSAADIRAAITATAIDAGPTGHDEKYGYGIVKALAAHNYLTVNPCQPPPPPVPVDCVGSWQWSECNMQCGGGTQDATYVITTQARYGGQACEAEDGAIESANCNIQPCGQAVNDRMTAVSGQWTVLNVFSNDEGTLLDVVEPAQAEKGMVKLSLQDANTGTTSGTQGSSLGVIMYKSPPGFIGVDRFSYSVIDSAGKETTARVTVKVTAGSCTNNMCSPGGTCNAATGQCQCSARSGMVAVFVRNPVQADRQVTPRVPACRYRTFKPVAPFNTKLVWANRSSLASIAFTLGDGKLCSGGQIVKSVRFTSQMQLKCVGAAQRAHLQRAGAAARAGELSCRHGQYTYVLRAPAAAGCYNMTIVLADSSKVSAPLTSL